MKTELRTAQAPQPSGPYSQGILFDQRFVFVAGQGAGDPATGKWVSDDFTRQAEQTLANVQAILEAAGCTMADVVKVGVFLTDLANFPALNEVYRRFFQAPYPARTTVQAGMAPGLLIEVDAIAIRPD